MISAEKKEKISTRRTYLLLSQALFSLLEENPFEKITLTQLCDASMVPRSTFYRYFEDKYDLLYYCLQTFFETVRLDRDIMYLKDGKGHAFVDKLISVIDQNKDSFTKICRTNKNGIFMDILRNYLMQIIEQILHQLQKEGSRFLCPGRVPLRGPGFLLLTLPTRSRLICPIFLPSGPAVKRGLQKRFRVLLP